MKKEVEQDEQNQKNGKREKGIRVNIYLTSRENNFLELNAKLAGKRKATMAREMIFANSKNYQAQKEIQPLLIDLAKETAKQGINLNQIARKLNSNREIESTEIQNGIAVAKKLHEQILNLLKKEF